MKKILIIAAVFLWNSLVFSQTKKEILYELQQYFVNTTYNKSYAIEKQKLFNAIQIVAAERYGTATKENLNKGLLEFQIQTDVYKETLSFDIIGEMPYQVIVSVKVEQRSINPDGTFSNWFTNNQTDNSYILGLHYRLYMAVYGPIVIPENIVAKINDFNSTQKKDKNKIIKGKDF